MNSVIITLYSLLTLVGIASIKSDNRTSGRLNPGYYWKGWKPGDSIVGAVVAGLNRYVGRVNTRRGYIIAMIGLKRNVAVAIVDKKETFQKGMEMLCATTPNAVFWEEVDFQTQSSHDLLRNAVRGGYQENLKTDLYIGRARHPQRYKVGKVVPPGLRTSGLWIWLDDDVVNLSNFQILRYNPK